ncbi:transglutaminase-like domain-containing protein [Glaciecola petra]|uniref:Transglutaminase-like domain-containing protein n=1 Tax=Glaciecola petra TaxID=3075602 RepID=A0ABU2ZPQ8_9ALTE|nr:transglutaminase-like domain-containing protein [Aestuariibacter sp. P117]MDT0594396.1 transglutaminase-like domain-containing protein [Aestuariibacter sp. P117]
MININRFIGVFLFALSLSAQAQSDPSFAHVQLDTHDSYEFPLADKISFSLFTQDAMASAKVLEQWSGLEYKVIDDNSIAVTLYQNKPTFNGSGDLKYKNDSFVIDISEQSTQNFIEGFTVPENSSNVLVNIEAYVSRFIENPTYEHGFNIASRVADNKSGDCTEYAVLTTALSRALDKPARLVFGTVFIESENGVEAVGHAWTEILHQQNWHIIDAALFGIEDGTNSSRVYYLPISTLVDEGPGFGFSIASSMVVMPYKIQGLRSAP